MDNVSIKIMPGINLFSIYALENLIITGSYVIYQPVDFD